MRTAPKAGIWPLIRNTGLFAVVSALAALNWHLLNTPVDIHPIQADAPRSVLASEAHIELAGGQEQRAAYRETLARPLFRPDRRPFAAEAPPPPAPPVEKPLDVAAQSPAVPIEGTPPGGIKLVGVMRDGSGSRRVFIRTALIPSASWLGIGDEIEGWRVAEIGQSTVTLENDDAKVSLELYPATAGEPANP